MKSKEEILRHLEATVYTHNARRSIVEWMLQHHVVKNKGEIKFLGHAYDYNGVRLTEGWPFEFFVEFVEPSTISSFGVGSAEHTPLAHDVLKGCISLHGLNDKIDKLSEETAAKIEEIYRQLNGSFSASYYVDPHAHLIQIDSIIEGDFQVGDVVKYIPDPDDTSDEYVEAIAHDSEGRVYLCLSNGEWVKPCYCVKYKYQGDERRALIDKLNEVL